MLSNLGEKEVPLMVAAMPRGVLRALLTVPAPEDDKSIRDFNSSGVGLQNVTLEEEGKCK